jgi:hypothetical protein
MNSLLDAPIPLRISFLEKSKAISRKGCRRPVYVRKLFGPVSSAIRLPPLTLMTARNECGISQ